MSGPDTEAFFMMANEMKSRGAMNLYIGNFKAILRENHESNDYDVGNLEYITDSEETRDASARTIFEHIVTAFIRGIQALASMRSLKGTFNAAQQNRIHCKDEHILF